ncbi:MAG TPA: OmpA family protein [Rhodanobacteraceae bacterium]
MKRKGLCLLIALALGGAVVAAQAQDAQSSGTTSGQDSSMSASSSGNYDGRWYLGPTAGVYLNDSNRQSQRRRGYLGLNLGSFISENTSIDLFIDHTSRTSRAVGGWVNNNFGLAARFYGGSWTSWRPYALAGIMDSRHLSSGDHGWSPAAELGFGLSKTVGDDALFRVGATYRYEWDDKTIPSQDGYGDWMLGVSLLAMLGSTPAPPPPPVPAAAPPPPPPAPTCDQLDSDHDGVNNCVDKCPNTPAGTIVGPDGCPQKVVIDLRGVNFKFDRPHKGETRIGPTLKVPTSDSLSILQQAVDTLKRYPKVVVKVVGYTDSVGSSAYNQKLSERRAQIVYNYLTSHGVDASRLEGPTGMGEADPIASNKTKDGRAQNRRVELKVVDQGN